MKTFVLNQKLPIGLRRMPTIALEFKPYKKNHRVFRGSTKQHNIQGHQPQTRQK